MLRSKNTGLFVAMMTKQGLFQLISCYDDFLPLPINYPIFDVFACREEESDGQFGFSMCMCVCVFL